MKHHGWRTLKPEERLKRNDVVIFNESTHPSYIISTQSSSAYGFIVLGYDNYPLSYIMEVFPRTKFCFRKVNGPEMNAAYSEPLPLP